MVVVAKVTEPSATTYLELTYPVYSEPLYTTSIRHHRFSPSLAVSIIRTLCPEYIKTGVLEVVNTADAEYLGSVLRERAAASFIIPFAFSMFSVPVGLTGGIVISGVTVTVTSASFSFIR